MYQILPFVSAADLALPDLPVELWSIILRLLDPNSLLTVVRTSKFWSKVSLGDPVLRKTVQEQVLLERQRHNEEIFNPGLLYTVVREGNVKLFGRNGKKIVTRRQPSRVQQVPAGFERLGRMKRSLPGNGGPLKKKQNVKDCCYRSMRC